MPILKIFSPSEQVAAHLREELLRGRWGETMPGAPALAAELGVDGKTVWAALGLLEQEGLLVSQGVGRRRRIVLPKDATPPVLRVAILDFEPLGETEEWSVGMQQRLVDEGHTAFFTEKALMELNMDVKRIAALVERTPADAWVVCSATREVLAWFAEQEKPAFALFGRRQDLPIAGVGPDHVTAGREVVRRLIELGHQRIVILVRESQWASGPSPVVQAHFAEMEAHGVPTGPYNLPNWRATPEGLERILEELFRVTPPTALMIDEPFLFHAVKEHLAQRGIVAPRDVSLVCSDPDPTFLWCRPTVAHVWWDHRLVVRRVARWANNIARGKKDRRQSFTKAEYVDGGTVGPVPGGA